MKGSKFWSSEFASFLLFLKVTKFVDIKLHDIYIGLYLLIYLITYFRHICLSLANKHF